MFKYTEQLAAVGAAVGHDDTVVSRRISHSSLGGTLKTTQDTIIVLARTGLVSAFLASCSKLAHGGDRQHRGRVTDGRRALLATASLADVHTNHCISTTMHYIDLPVWQLCSDWLSRNGFRNGFTTSPRVHAPLDVRLPAHLAHGTRCLPCNLNL